MLNCKFLLYFKLFELYLFFLGRKALIVDDLFLDSRKMILDIWYTFDFG